MITAGLVGAREGAQGERDRDEEGAERQQDREHDPPQAAQVARCPARDDGVYGHRMPGACAGARRPASGRLVAEVPTDVPVVRKAGRAPVP